MKRYLSAFIVIFTLFSCKKNCTIIVDNNNISGKIKSLSVYNNDSLYNNTKFYFYYDSIGGLLTTIDAYIKFQGIDTFIVSYFNIIRQNDNNLRIYNNFYGTQYKVNINDKQITSIYKISNDVEEMATSIFLDKDNVDSIYDIGNFLQTNIHLSDFKFNSGNCISYYTNWLEFTGSNYNYRTDTIHLTYNNTINNRVVFNQIIGSEYGGGSIFNEIIYFIGIDGYYILKPNSFLIDTVRYKGNAYTKYNYTIDDNKIMKVHLLQVNGIISENSYQDIEYY